MLEALQGRRYADPGWTREVADAIAYRPSAWDSVEVPRKASRCTPCRSSRAPPGHDGGMRRRRVRFRRR